jgi:integrase
MLSAKKVQRVKERGRYYDAGSGGVRGFCLQVSANGAKSWLLRYQLNGKKRWMGLGSFPTFSLAEARERARRERQKLADGLDPVLVRRTERAAQKAARTITFKEAAEQFHRGHAHEWRNAKHANQVINTLRQYAFPILGEMEVAHIATGDVLRVIEPLWVDKNATASRVRGRIETVLGWATVRGYRSGDNPARWKQHLSEALPRKKVAGVEHHAALPYAELPGFMAELRKHEGVAARALEFLILTAARTGEVIGAKWDEVDLAERLWTVPPERMKAHRPHTVTLPISALELLKNLPRDRDGFVFIGSKPGTGLSDTSLNRLLKRMGQDGLTVHGFRSSFRDWAAEQTNFPREVCEMALAHAIGDKTEASYRRGDLRKKRFLLAEAWAKYCASTPIKKADDKTVVPMHMAAR